ncbi:hypothetical protein [Sphingomonas faeni]|uniref:hypothetical protein n=1 Tax=Sphingomonas faeni TaxID=185950 RepID=UPI0033604D0A
MNNIPLGKMVIVWNLMDGKSGPPLKVVDSNDKEDEDYISSWGACNSEFSQASNEKKLRMLLTENINLTVNEGIPPTTVHEALMVIPEYRAALMEAAVIPDPDEY